jgi:DNA helicase-2/ATP-dependent DNA helicase PcrA
MIEQNLIKPKTKIGLSFFLNALNKWRNDLNIKKINHIKLLQIVLDESGYSAMLKNKKDLDNENRLENIKELLSAMKEFDNLESFLEHVSLATSIDQEWDGEKD